MPEAGPSWEVSGLDEGAVSEAAVQKKRAHEGGDSHGLSDIDAGTTSLSEEPVHRCLVPAVRGINRG